MAQAQFPTTGPDGTTYFVNADSQEEADAKLLRELGNPDNYVAVEPVQQAAQAQFPKGTDFIEIKESGGKLYRTPTGDVGYIDSTFSTTDPITIQRIQTGERLEDILREGFQKSVIETNPVLARGVTYLKGLPFVGEYIDEMAGELYGPERQEQARTLSRSMEEQRPVESALGQIGVGVTSTAPLGTVVPAYTTTRGGRALQRGVEGGLFGSGEGLVSGYGAGETPDERIAMAKDRGLFGLFFGAPLSTAAGTFEGIVEGAKRINYSELAQELGISDDAATVIGRLAMEGATLADIEKRLTTMGARASLANAGPSAKTLLDAVQAASPGALEVVTTGVRQTGREVRQDFDRALDDLLGTPGEGPKQIFASTATRTAADRNEKYRQAYSVIFDYSSSKGKKILDAIDTIPERYLDDAVKRANEIIQSEQLVVPQFKTVMRNGKLTIEQAPNIVQLDILKRSLGDIITRETDNLTGQISDVGQTATTLYRRLNNAMQNASPTYRTAVKSGLDNIQESQAIRLVTKFNTSKYEDWINLIRRTTGDAKKQVKESMLRMLRTQIDETLGNARAVISNPDSTTESVNAALKLFKDMTTGNARKKLRLIMDNETFRDFQLQMRKIAEQLDLQAKTSRGSATAFRTQGSEAIDEVLEPGIIRSAISGELGVAGRKLIEGILGSIADTDTEKMKVLEEVGTALLAQRGDVEARRIAGIIKRIRLNESVTAEEAQMAAQTIQAFVRSGIYESAQQATN